MLIRNKNPKTVKEIAEDINDESHDRYKNFARFFNETADTAHANSVDKGFWDATSDDGTKIALMHSELSEALEAVRKPELEGHINESHTLLEEELADTVIRIMDFASSKGMDVGGAIIAKMQFNRSRTAMHGGKKF